MLATNDLFLAISYYAKRYPLGQLSATTLVRVFLYVAFFFIFLVAIALY